MRDSIYIGETPNTETCEQMGDNYDSAKARRECRAYINQLRRVYGQEPAGAMFKVKSNPHDFGSYLSVECYYDDNNEEAMNYAFNAEAGCDEWDAEAKAELALTNT